MASYPAKPCFPSASARAPASSRCSQPCPGTARPRLSGRAAAMLGGAAGAGREGVGRTHRQASGCGSVHGGREPFGCPSLCWMESCRLGAGGLAEGRGTQRLCPWPGTRSFSRARCSSLGVCFPPSLIFIPALHRNHIAPGQSDIVLPLLPEETNEKFQSKHLGIGVGERTLGIFPLFAKTIGAPFNFRRCLHPLPLWSAP